MKILMIPILLIAARLSAFGQKTVFLKEFDFDSSYAVIGLGESFQGRGDSLSRFWFILENPDDMNALKKDWILKKEPIRTIEFNSISVFITRNKQRVQGGALIYPLQGCINVQDVWYKFDTAKLDRLHKEHPLKFHTETRRYDTFQHYVADANGLLRDSLLLFFFEPTLTYEGSFTITASKTNSPGSDILVGSDINKELQNLAPAGSFTASPVLNDSFNISSPDKVRITVHSAKSLYDKYKGRHVEKGAWQPAGIEMKIFWRD
jgi:hypothetical protein